MDGVGPSETKKKRGDVEDDVKTREEIKNQNKTIYKYRDLLEKHLSKSELQQLLEYNGQEIPSGTSKVNKTISSIYESFLIYVF